MTRTATSARARKRLDWTEGPHGVRVRPVVVHGEKVLYGLQPKQLDAYRLTPLCRTPGPQATRIGYGGAAGGGKSHLARAVAVSAAFQWPGSTSIIFRRTQKEVYENHITKLKEEVLEDLGLWEWNGKYMELTWRNGSRTIFGFLRNAGDEYNYQGNSYDLMVFEEATHYRWSAVSWLIGNRLRSDAEGTTPFALFPSNPGNIGHFWFKRLFISRRYDPERAERPEDHAFVQSFLHDNQILERRDPSYRRKLETLASPYREWLMDGSFEAGAGMALSSLRRETHLVEPFDVPAHWPMFGGFDWGYAHPWVFGIYASNEDGRVFKVDTFRGRRQTVQQIISTIQELAEARGIELSRLGYIAADRIVFTKRGQEIGYDGPTYGEKMIDAGLSVVPANNERIRGLQRLREYIEPDEHGDPHLVLMRTQGNERCFEGLEAMVEDPDRPEDALKVDADEFGSGGDDDYDETRYAIASRPELARSVGLDRELGAFDAEVLAHEERTGRTVKDLPLRSRGPRHPELGGYI